MSKFLKIIVNLVVLLVVVVTAALMVPQFVGIETVMNDNSEIETNLPIGSVAYGKSVSAEKLKKGDQVIYSEGAETYIYEILDMDASAGSYEVKDVYNVQSQKDVISLPKNASKVMLIVPFIGYAAIVLQSTEGLIMIGLGIILLIILFILSELWRKDEDEEDEEEEEDEDDDEEDEEDEEDDAGEEPGFWERRRLKKEEKRRRKLEEQEEEDSGEEEAGESEKQEEIQEAEALKDAGEEGGEETPSEEEAQKKAEQAMEAAMASVAMNIRQISEPEQASDATVVLPEIKEIQELKGPEVLAEADEELPEAEKEAFEEAGNAGGTETAAKETAVIDEMEEMPAEETAEEMPEEEAAIAEEPEEEEQESFRNPDAILPSPSVQELLQKAQAAGENPEVKRDEKNEVTLLDYSDIL